ncbi:hypothetical protein QTP70_033049 [Hemibagrus guttatus]|uniref:Coiled-coil domain-containing protein 137 n=1 Tax=Hemibagrus guttatus TaxID=175788 RepID=A0AAE0QFQ9_9TELE|nr:hypothetical protein QTP70_033049 [Hemibagrus guttatus]
MHPVIKNKNRLRMRYENLSGDANEVAMMGKNSQNKASKFSHQQTEVQNSSKKLKKNDIKPHLEEHLEQIPFQLRRIMKSKEKMNIGSSKLKKIMRDKVQFGEVAMAPPSLNVKPKKAHVKPQRTSNSLLLSSILGHTDVSTAKPSMARQKIIEGEHERVVHAYRQLKRNKSEKLQKERINKFLNP